MIKMLLIEQDPNSPDVVRVEAPPHADKALFNQEHLTVSSVATAGLHNMNTQMTHSPGVYLWSGTLYEGWLQVLLYPGWHSIMIEFVGCYEVVLKYSYIFCRGFSCTVYGMNRLVRRNGT